MAARAAEEDREEGNKDITPYWRTIKEKGILNEKYPGGIEAQAKKLKAEGHEIVSDRSGKPKKIKDWEKKLVDI